MLRQHPLTPRPLTPQILERSIKLLFETRDISQVKQFVQRQCVKVLEGRASMQDLTFAKEYRGSASYRPGACVPALELTRCVCECVRTLVFPLYLRLLLPGNQQRLSASFIILDFIWLLKIKRKKPLIPPSSLPPAPPLPCPTHPPSFFIHLLLLCFHLLHIFLSLSSSFPCSLSYCDTPLLSPLVALSPSVITLPHPLSFPVFHCLFIFLLSLPHYVTPPPVPSSFSSSSFLPSHAPLSSLFFSALLYLFYCSLLSSFASSPSCLLLHPYSLPCSSFLSPLPPLPSGTFFSSNFSSTLHLIFLHLLAPPLPCLCPELQCLLSTHPHPHPGPLHLPLQAYDGL